MPDSESGHSPGATAVRTIKLCAAPTRRPTTLLDAIARSVAELEKSGRPVRTIRLQIARAELP